MRAATNGAGWLVEEYWYACGWTKRDCHVVYETHEEAEEYCAVLQSWTMLELRVYEALI